MGYTTKWQNGVAIIDATLGVIGVVYTSLGSDYPKDYVSFRVSALFGTVATMLVVIFSALSNWQCQERPAQNDVEDAGTGTRT